MPSPTLPHRASRFSTLALATLVVARLAAPAIAAASQEPAPQPPSFLIETIVVEQAERFPAEIIIAESLLREGRVYSERELRDAVSRIVRLPLILDAEFSLRKGSQRGRYQLVIEVEEARRWFFGSDSEAEIGDLLGFIPGIDFPEDDEDLNLFAGWRIAAGRSGVFSLAYGPSEYGEAQLGYTQYNLFGRSVQLNFNVLYEPLYNETRESDNRQLRLSLGVPIRGNHSLRLSSSYRSSGLSYDLFAGPRIDLDTDRLIANVSWVYNSIDDPVFPTAGLFVRGGFEYRRRQETDTRRVIDSGGSVISEVTRTDLDETRLAFAGDRYWRLSARQALSLSLDLSAGSAEVLDIPLFRGDEPETGVFDTDVWETEITLGHAAFLWVDRKRPHWRELRWENELSGFWEGTSPDLGLPWNPRSGVRLATGLRFRTTWGVFRYRLTYISSEDTR